MKKLLWILPLVLAVLFVDEANPVHAAGGAKFKTYLIRGGAATDNYVPGTGEGGTRLIIATGAINVFGASYVIASIQALGNVSETDSIFRWSTSARDTLQGFVAIGVNTCQKAKMVCAYGTGGAAGLNTGRISILAPYRGGGGAVMAAGAGNAGDSTMVNYIPITFAKFEWAPKSAAADSTWHHIWESITVVYETQQ